MTRNCPICFSSQTEVFLNRMQVPVHQNLVCATVAEARQIARGILTMAICHDCSFVWNQDFDLSRISYGESYDNNQACSAHFDSYLTDLANMLVHKEDVRNLKVVEVGCGNGHFLRKLCSIPEANLQGFGFDPSYRPMQDEPENLRFFTRYYDAECAQIEADVVVCRHVIEHVPDPVALLSSVAQAVRLSPKARIFFETPCVEWILRNQVIWDFFYEHCSLFSSHSIAKAFAKAGFQTIRVQHIFGGQYLWAEARLGEGEWLENSTELVSLARSFREVEMDFRDNCERKIQDASQSGGVALWGAGAKGATLANLVDPEAKLLRGVIDLNPNKQGRYIPGTGHPIISPKDHDRLGVHTAYLMNPNYLAENRQLIRAQDLTLQLENWS